MSNKTQQPKVTYTITSGTLSTKIGGHRRYDNSPFNAVVNLQCMTSKRGTVRLLNSYRYSTYKRSHLLKQNNGSRYTFFQTPTTRPFNPDTNTLTDTEEYKNSINQRILKFSGYINYIVNCVEIVSIRFVTWGSLSIGICLYKQFLHNSPHNIYHA